jgi:hypothetical protein
MPNTTNCVRGLVNEQEARIQRNKLEMEVMSNALTKKMLDAALAPNSEQTRHVRRRNRTPANALAQGKDAAQTPVEEQNPIARSCRRRLRAIND